MKSEFSAFICYHFCRIWNAKLTETRIFSLIEFNSIRELFNSIRELFNLILELSLYV